MNSNPVIIAEKPFHYRIIKMKVFRKTEGVTFDLVPLKTLSSISAVDRVLHRQGAISPGAVDEHERPWYMHTHQEDNLLVLQGVRYVELYSMQTKELTSFEVGPDYLKQDGELIHQGGCVLSWPVNVFHRIISGVNGSASINFAHHLEGMDFRTNFNIYDLDLSTGQHKVVRYGYEDQS